MNKMFTIKDEVYTHFKASLILTGENENEVLEHFLVEYAQRAFAKVTTGNTTQASNAQSVVPQPASNPTVQQQYFVKWFEGLVKSDGTPYKKTTIYSYVGYIEGICHLPDFSTISTTNLFSITDLNEYRSIFRQIEITQTYKTLNQSTNGGYRAALRKYDEFLRYQSGNTSALPLFLRSNDVHKWTFEEDYISCREFLATYAVNKSHQEIESFLSFLSPKIPAVTKSSLRMKLQNIKNLAINNGIFDTASIKPLTGYSAQCEHAFYQAMTDLNLKGNQ